MKFYKQRSKGKTFTQPSLTIPDETMSIREIMRRHVRGLPIVGEKTPIYDEMENAKGINPKTLDLVDLENLYEDTKENVTSLQEGIKKSKARVKSTDSVDMSMLNQEEN